MSRGLACAVLLAACVAWLAPAGATAAVGELSFDACIGHPDHVGCASAPIVAPKSVAAPRS